MAARVDAGGGTGSARRRRERRLRSHLRHERMAVAMALAESTHHSAQRHKMARARREARDALHGRVPEAPLSQGRVLRHFVGHLPVPALGVPVPQMMDQLPDIEKFFSALSPDPEQVIEVPKILPFDVPLTLQLVMKNAQMSLAKGFFRTFPQNKKKCEVGFALESEGARQWQPIHAGCSAGGRALA